MEYEKAKNKVVVIEWIDSVEYVDADWKDEDDAHSLRPVNIKSAGILVKEEKTHVTIASSIDQSDPENLKYGGLLAIPYYSIIKRSDTGQPLSEDFYK